MYMMCIIQRHHCAAHHCAASLLLLLSCRELQRETTDMYLRPELLLSTAARASAVTVLCDCIVTAAAGAAPPVAAAPVADASIAFAAPYMYAPPRVADLDRQVN